MSSVGAGGRECAVGDGVDLSRVATGAMVASYHNAALKTFHGRLIVAGEPKRVTLITTARKPIIILNAILRDGTPWQSV